MSEKHHNYNGLNVGLTLENLTRILGKTIGRFMDHFKSEALLLMDGLDKRDLGHLGKDAFHWLNP